MRKMWPLLAVGLLALAGCFGDGPSDAGAMSYSFGDPVAPADAPDGFGSEPSVLAASDGSLYIVSVLGSAEARGDGAWKSTDHGQTWRYLGKVDFPFGGGDSDFDEDDSGRLYVTGQWRPVALPVYVTGGESVYTSMDGGDTWTPSPIAGYLPAADRQWVVTHGNSTAWLFYNQMATGFMVTKSTDGGLTWGAPTVVGEPGPPTGIAGDAVADDEGILYVPYGPGPGADGLQRVLRSRDGGASWEAIVVHDSNGTPTGGVFSTLALDTEGGLYLVWTEQVDGVSRILLSHSEDQATTWSDAVVASDPGLTAVMPWVVAGAPGRVAVAYYGTTGEYPVSDDADADAEWFPHVTFLGDARDAATARTTVALQAEPNHVGPICTGGTGCDPQYRLLGDFFEADLMKDGRVAVVYVDDHDEPRTNKVVVQSEGSLLP